MAKRRLESMHGTREVKDQDVQVLSLAKKTLGSTRTGSAIRLPAVRWRSGWVDIVSYGAARMKAVSKVGGKLFAKRMVAVALID